MALHFDAVRLEGQRDYFTFLDSCPQKTSDYSFLNLWSWADVYGIQWAWTPELVWIRQTRPHEIYWAPVGDWRKVNWPKTLDRHLNGDVSFDRVPETLLTTWQQAAGIDLAPQPSRGHWDYLYAVSDLIALKGNRYHKKKNLLNQFIKRHDFQYELLTENDIHRAIDMQESWCTWRDCEALEALEFENQAILRVLENWRHLERLMGGAILIENRMVAYTVAERLSADTLLIHFEKGDPDIKGVYQAINQMFIENTGHGFTTVNREQDLDNEGLRKAKMSYHPVGFNKKFAVRISGGSP